MRTWPHIFQPRENLNHRFVSYLMILSIFPLLILGISSFQIARSALRSEAEHHLRQLVGERQRFLNLQVEQVESLIANISGVEAITNALASPFNKDDDFTILATQARIGYILNGYADINGLVSIDIFSFNGAHYHVGDTLDIGYVRKSVLHDVKEKTAASGRPVHWVGIIDNVNGNSRTSKTVTASKIITVLDKSTLTQVPVGILLVNFDPIYLHAQFKTGDQAGVRLAIIDEAMRLVYDTDPARVGMTADDSIVARLGGGPERESSSTDGSKHLVSVLRSESTGWSVAGTIPLAIVQAHASGIGKATALVVLACLMVAGVAAWLYARHVVAPIRRITSHFQNFMEHGHHEQARLPVRGRGEIANLTRWFNAFLDGQLERESAQSALRASEARFRRLADANIIGLFSWDVQGGVMDANDAFLEITGHTPRELTSGAFRWNEITLTRDFSVDQQTMEDIREKRSWGPVETTFTRQDGSSVSALFGGAFFDDTPDKGIAFILDLSERKRAEERQKLLIDELNHRVKNTLAVVQAIALQTSHYSASLEAFIQGFQSRLLALSKTHNLLTKNVWQGVDLRDVVQLELMPHANDDPSRFTVQGFDVCIAPKAAVTLGLAFHELATNAAKFGALSVPSGRVVVTWDRTTASERKIRLEWLEREGPPVKEPNHQGFGSRLIEDGLTLELAGTVHLDFLPQGLRCVMELPLDRVAVS